MAIGNTASSRLVRFCTKPVCQRVDAAAVCARRYKRLRAPVHDRLKSDVPENLSCQAKAKSEDQRHL
jgi:hypothetical protein